MCLYLYIWVYVVLLRIHAAKNTSKIQAYEHTWALYEHTQIQDMTPTQADVAVCICLYLLVCVCICMYSISNKKVLSIIEFLTWAFIYDLGVWVLYVSGMYLHVCDSICMHMYVFWFICWYEIHDALQQGCVLSVRAPQATVRASQATVRASQAQEAPCST